MPSLGADMEAGILSKWLVKPGDRVEKGDLVAIVETEKSDIEVEIFTAGTVDKILVETGKKVPVGTLLATISTISTDGEGPVPETISAPVPAPPAAAPPPASPAARKRAAELGIDLATVKGSGPGGAVTLGDIEKAPPAGKVVEKDRAASMRKAIAASMARSNREIPHYYLAADVDMSRALAWLEEENRRRSVEERLLPAALLLKAVALALREIPELNGFWEGGEGGEGDGFRPGPGIHPGVAVSIRGGGLIAPAIHDADRKSPGELMAALRDLVQRARAGTLRSSEMTDPTITVTNLGDQGVGTVFGVIQPPQVALVGFGRIVERPWAEAGTVVVRPVLTATLSADHRATDGHLGGRFLSTLARLLQEPISL
jgi:pyruvate dehydrogenase E2 component (dihydrolipoamide acetyltransferase)